MNNVTYIRLKPFPQNRSRLIERSICNFMTRRERRATKDDKRRREEDRVKRSEGNERREKIDQFYVQEKEPCT